MLSVPAPTCGNKCRSEAAGVDVIAQGPYGAGLKERGCPQRSSPNGSLFKPPTLLDLLVDERIRTALRSLHQALGRKD